ncbi:MAG: hypothetical protein WAY02_07340, partial [Burkholderiaceae bacterium]
MLIGLHLIAAGHAEPCEGSVVVLQEPRLVGGAVSLGEGADGVGGIGERLKEQMARFMEEARQIRLRAEFNRELAVG